MNAYAVRSRSRAVSRVGRGREFRPIAALTVTEGAARLLSFLFYVLAARALTPAGFGRVRYTLTIVLIAFFLLQVVVKAIARELGGARGNEEATARLIGSSVCVTAILLVLTAGVCLLAYWGGLLGAVDCTGLVVALLGYTSFQAYYAIARGVGETLRPALAYVGGSLVQLAVFAVLVAGGSASAREALVIYGLSSVVPIVACELWRPIVLNHLRPEAAAVRRLLMTGAPLIVGQVGFIVWNSADQIWVQSQLGTHDVGLYGAARNLSQLFIVIPTGVGIALLPRVAELRSAGAGRQARRLTLWCTVGVSAVTAVLAGIVIVGRETLLGMLYGTSYRPAGTALMFQSLGMVFYAAFATLTAAAIGWGWSRLSVVGIGIAGLSEVGALMLLPGHGLATAAVAFAMSIGVALVSVLLWSRVGSEAQLKLAVQGASR